MSGIARAARTIPHSSRLHLTHHVYLRKDDALAEFAAGSRRPEANLRSSESPTEIAKSFLLAKTFRAHSTNSLLQEKSLRDHVDAPGRPNVIRRHASALMHHKPHGTRR